MTSIDHKHLPKNNAITFIAETTASAVLRLQEDHPRFHHRTFLLTELTTGPLDIRASASVYVVREVSTQSFGCGSNFLLHSLSVNHNIRQRKQRRVHQKTTESLNHHREKHTE